MLRRVPWTPDDAARLRSTRRQLGHTQSDCIAELRRLGSPAFTQSTLSTYERRPPDGVPELTKHAIDRYVAGEVANPDSPPVWDTADLASIISTTSAPHELTVEQRQFRDVLMEKFSSGLAAHEVEAATLLSDILWFGRPSRSREPRFNPDSGGVSGSMS